MADGRILVDGKESDRIAVLDRGFQYGDGLFETIKITDGIAEFWGRHMARLVHGCGRLGIPAPDAALLKREAARLCANERSAVLKIMVTRGGGGRGYRPPDSCTPSRIAALFPAPDYPENIAERGVRLRFCETRLANQPRLAGLKHLNRLEQVLARGEWSDADIAEGLMCDAAGSVIEGTMSNLFMVAGGALHTPDLSRCGVAGILRAVVIELAGDLGIEMKTRRIARDELDAADEVFVTNSVIGIWPVRAIENRDYRPGSITSRLAAALARLDKGV